MTVLLIFDQIKTVLAGPLSPESEFESLSLCQFPEPSQITEPLSICTDTSLSSISVMTPPVLITQPASQQHYCPVLVAQVDIYQIHYLFLYYSTSMLLFYWVFFIFSCANLCYFFQFLEVKMVT